MDVRTEQSQIAPSLLLRKAPAALIYRHRLAKLSFVQSEKQHVIFKPTEPLLLTRNLMAEIQLEAG